MKLIKLVFRWIFRIYFILIFQLLTLQKSIGQCSLSVGTTDSILVCGESARLYLNIDWQVVSGTNFKNLKSLSFPSKEIGFIAGDSGSIYKTENGGMGFTPVNSPKPQSKLNSIWFTHPQKGFAFTDSSEIFRTINSGAVWSKINYVYSVDSNYTWNYRNFNSSCFINGKTGFVAGGIYSPSGNSQAILHTTNDSGNTWTQINVQAYKPIRKVYFLDSLTGFICTDGVLAKTANGGISWVSVLNYPTLYFYDITFINKDTGFLASNGLMKTVDGGNTWTVINSPGYNAYHINSDQNGFVYIIWGNSIYRSVDLGISWQQLKINTTLSGMYDYLTDFTFGHQIPGIAIGYNSINQNGFVIKTDQLDSVFWGPELGLLDTLSTSPIVNPNASTTYFVSAKIGQCIASSDITISVVPIKTRLPFQQILSCGDSLKLNPEINTSNIDLYNFTWNPETYLTNSHILKPVALIKSNIKYTLTVESANGCKDTATTNARLNFAIETGPNLNLKCGDQILLNTNENGWNQQSISLFPATQLGLKDISFPSLDTAYLVGGRNIWKSLDGGKNWQVNYAIPSPGIIPKKAHFLNSKYGFVAGFNDGPMVGGILKTNNGLTWQTLNVGGNYQIPSIFFTSEQQGFAVGNPGKILKTTNGGNNWLAINSNTSATINDIYFPNSTVGYAVGSNGTILKTTNAGTTWTNLNTPISNVLNSVFFTSIDTGFTGGSGDTIWKTTNGGISWNYFRINYHFQSNFWINDIHFESNKIGYLACNYSTTIPMFNGGAVFETRNGGESWERIRIDSSQNLVAIYTHQNGFGMAIGGNEQFLLRNIPATNFIWSPSIGLNNPFEKTCIAKPTQTTSYTITSSIGDCNSKDSLTLNVNRFLEPNFKEKEVVCGDSLKLEHLNVLLDINASNQGLSSWQIVNSTQQVIMASTPNTRTFGNFEFAPGLYTFICRPKVIPPPLYIRIIPITGDSINEIITTTSDSVITRTFTIGNTTNYLYQWQPNQEIITPLSLSKTYHLTITANNGCVSYDSLKIIPKPLWISLKKNRTEMDKYSLTCGSSIQLDSILTNYSGSQILPLVWSDPSLVNDSNSYYPLVSPNASKKLFLNTYTLEGCFAKDSVEFLVEPIWVQVMDTIVTCKQKFSPNYFHNYLGSQILNYTWLPNLEIDSNLVQHPHISPSENRIYSLTINTWNGCTAKDSFEVNLGKGLAPSLCIVSVGEQGKNLIIWNKTEAIGAEKFYLYKESNITNQYEKIGEMSPDSDFIFIDTLSAPLVQSNKYLLEKMDACGINSHWSDAHKTMHLTINKGSGTTWNLLWNYYEGFLVSTYNIYRGSTPTSMTLIGSTSGSNNSYSDFTAPAGDIYYQVEIISPNFCTPNKTWNSSKSNIMSNTYLGINKISRDLGINVFPNPAQDYINIVFENKNLETSLSIYSLQGKCLTKKFLFEPNQQISLAGFIPGIYMFEFTNEEGKYHKFVVKE